MLRAIRLIRPAHAAVALAVVCGLVVATFVVDAADPRGTPRALASSPTPPAWAAEPSITLPQLPEVPEVPATVVPEPPPPAATPSVPASPAPTVAPLAPPPPTAPPVIAAPPAGLAGAVFTALNAARGANGLASLGADGRLGALSQDWAQWMAEHASLTHQNPQSLLVGTGWTSLGQVLFSGSQGYPAASIVDAWLSSPVHRATILGAFSAVGVGVAVGSDGKVWIAVDVAA